MPANLAGLAALVAVCVTGVVIGVPANLAALATLVAVGVTGVVICMLTCRRFYFYAALVARTISIGVGMLANLARLVTFVALSVAGVIVYMLAVTAASRAGGEYHSER